MASGDTLFRFMAQDGVGPASNYATLDVRNGHVILAFDQTTQETTIFEDFMPEHYAGGDIVVEVAAMLASGVTSGTLGWGISFERGAGSSDDLDSDSFDTETLGTPATVPGTSGVILVWSVTIPVANVDDIAGGDSFRLRLRRDVANDNAVGDAQFVGLIAKEA